MAKILRDGIDYSTPLATDANLVDYNNSSAGLSATNVQDAIDELSEKEIPIASADLLGGVKVGTNLNITAEGVLNAVDTKDAASLTYNNETSGLEATTVQGAIDELKAEEYVLPIASKDVLGGIKVGTNLSIDENGVLSSKAGGGNMDYLGYLGPDFEYKGLPGPTPELKGATMYVKAEGDYVINIVEFYVQKEWNKLYLYYTSDFSGDPVKIYEAEKYEDVDVDNKFIFQYNRRIRGIEPGYSMWRIDSSGLPVKDEDIPVSSTETTEGQLGFGNWVQSASESMHALIGDTFLCDGNKWILLHTSSTGSSTLPVATSDTLGGIKVGRNLSITEDGVLSAEAGGGSGAASDISYDNTDSGLEASNVQDAIDELNDTKLALDGGSVSGLTEFQQGTQCWILGESSTEGAKYVKIAEIQFTGNYQDSPIIFEMIERDSWYPTYLVFKLYNGSIPKPTSAPDRFHVYGYVNRTYYCLTEGEGKYGIWVYLPRFIVTTVTSLTKQKYMSPQLIPITDISTTEDLSQSANLVATSTRMTLSDTVTKALIADNATTATFCSGNAATASALTSKSIGSATKPVYFNANGVPAACTYSLEKSVPSDAVFTDTTYSSLSASNGSSTVSLCTRGEKYTWNNKAEKAGSTSQNFACNQLSTKGHIITEDKVNWMVLRSDQGAVCRNYANSAYTTMNASAFTQQSSRRYKENIESMTDEYAKKILELRPVKYDYINKEDGVNRYGLIAEEVAELETYPVSYRDGEIEGLDYSAFVPQLIKMVQIQQNEINELKAVIEELKTK